MPSLIGEIEMRVLFVTNPGEGQLYPMIPLAWAFSAAGHEVLVGAPADFLPKIRRVGLSAAASTQSLDMLEIMTTASGGSLRPTDIPLEGQVRAAARGFAIMAERTMDSLSALVRTWQPDLLVTESTCFVTSLVAAQQGLPYVEHRPGLAMPTFLRKLVAEELARDVPEPILVVDNCPRSFQLEDVPAGQVTRYVPYNGPGEVTSWMLSKGEARRVLITLGTGVPHDPNSWSLLELMTAALDKLSVEMVLAVPDPEDVGAPRLGALPASVLAVGRFPLSALVPTCDLVINHGGRGSAMTTLVNGLPQLAVPHYGDQFLTASQVLQRGVGLMVPVGEISTEAVGAAAAALLDEPKYTEAARGFAEENARQPSPAELVSVLSGQIGK
jgi:L-demethylnoviosyl transferase